jgi:acid stress chaperone HdeB
MVVAKVADRAEVATYQNGRRSMNRMGILIAGGAFFIASSAQANILDLRKLTCDDIAKGSTQDNTTIAVWLNGYYMENDAEAIIDFDKVNDLGNALVKFCAANLKMPVSDAAEKIMGKSR